MKGKSAYQMFCKDHPELDSLEDRKERSKKLRELWKALDTEKKAEYVEKEKEAATELQEVRERVVALERMKKEDEKELEEKKKELEGLKSEMKAVQAQLAELQKENEELATNYGMKEEEAEKLKGQVAAMTIAGKPLQPIVLSSAASELSLRLQSLRHGVMNAMKEDALLKTMEGEAPEWKKNRASNEAVFTPIHEAYQKKLKEKTENQVAAKAQLQCSS